MKRTILFSVLLSLGLSACQSQMPAVPQPSASPGNGSTQQGSSTLFGQALSKRTLSLDLFGQTGEGNTDNATGAPASESAARPEAQSGMSVAPMAPGAMPSADIAPGGRLMMPGWFGEFNQYTLQFAEESVFPASSTWNLLSAYNQTVKPLIQNWDARARLVESTAYVGQQAEGAARHFLPDGSGEPTEMAVRLMYRLASSERKETLVVYLTDTETRLHRLVWGEPHMDLSTLKIDSNAARNIALQAFQNRAASPGYPVYPEQSQPEMEVLYTVPANASWQFYLNQHSAQNSRYFVSVSFPVANPSYPDERVHGSAEIDAVSGEVLQLNRPVYYRPHMGRGDISVGSGGEVGAAPPPEIMPMQR
ncbi:MAG: hypothetical protein IGS03_11930 [Candidatus Sericytochromatia bacterium]|nr:hypothetical protein [Candidatus Sericytochromatia bacterium]